MYIQPNFDNIKIDGRKSLAKKQISVGCNISPHEQKGIKKILGVEGAARITNSEALVDEIKLNGLVNFKVLYLDSENEVLSLDYIAEFTDTIQQEGVALQSKIIPTASVGDISVSATDNQIKLMALTELNIDELSFDEMKVLVDVSDNCLKQIKDIRVQNLTGSGEGSFEIAEEFETNTNIDKVLLFDSAAVVTDIKCGIDSVLVSGEIITDIIYKGTTGIITKCFSMPFSEEVTVNGAFAGQKVSVRAEITDSKIILSGNETNNLIKAQIQLKICANTYEDKSIEVVSDIYCAEKELIKETLVKDTEYYTGCKFFDEKINGTAQLDVQMTAIKDIITTSASKSVLVNLIPNKDSVTAEGVVSAAVIYEDDNSDINSVQVELPYSIELRADNVTANSKIKGTVTLSNIYARAKRDKEIEAIAELKFCLEIFDSGSIEYISALEEGEDKISSKNAISVYLAEKGETMWDIAKALNMKPEEILKQNPDLKEPVESNMPVCIFRKISLD